MALTGVLRPGFIQIRVFDLHASVEHYVKRVGLHKVATGEDGRVYLKAADEVDHHSIVLREAASAGFDLVAFKVAREADLDEFARRIQEFGYNVDDVPAGEQPGIGRRIGWTLESGHRMELYHAAEPSHPRPSFQNPEVWELEPRGMRARRFDHAQLNGPHIERVLEFFEKVLEFSLVERIEGEDGLLAIFLSCGMKAHDIAFLNFPEPDKLHHVSFELETWNDLGHAADIIARYDVSIEIGPTRHGATQGRTIYFFDPSGNRNEVFTGSYTFYPDHPVRTWDARHLPKGVFYYERKIIESFLSVMT